MERRQHPRLRLGSPVQFEIRGRRLPAELANVSIRGAKIIVDLGDTPVSLGDRCAIVAEGERMEGAVAGLHADGPRILFV